MINYCFVSKLMYSQVFTPQYVILFIFLSSIVIPSLIVRWGGRINSYIHSRNNHFTCPSLLLSSLIFVAFSTCIAISSFCLSLPPNVTCLCLSVSLCVFSKVLTSLRCKIESNGAFKSK